MPSRRNYSRPDAAPEEAQHPAQPATEAMTVPDHVAALFRAHGVPAAEPPRRENEFTAQEWALWKGITPTSASNELSHNIRKGLMARRMVDRQYVYRYIDAPEAAQAVD